MASASPTADGIASEYRDRSGEAFDSFTGGTATSQNASPNDWGAERWSEWRLRDAGHPRAEGHGHVP